jgi:hypothetical protein
MINIINLRHRMDNFRIKVQFLAGTTRCSLLPSIQTGSVVQSAPLLSIQWAMVALTRGKVARV